MKQPFTIILIDDNSADNYYHRLIIEETDVTQEVMAFQYAEEALMYLQTATDSSIDLIFLDINMPRMNGFQFLEAYQSLNASRKAKIVVIMLTTSLNPQDETRAKSFIEVSGFLTKPLTPEVLLEIVESNFDC